ncbi:MAG TPA: methylenetetrahydrofolate reductase [NAD(P)H] [Selenomonadales bacterium]|nr:methylenetetrahydrofolate reductase [NAD(P)H] [Selenomonadales bacterium]
MRISNIFAGSRPVVSFEVFPPKPESPVETIYTALGKLRDLNPAFISVTYGAGGSTTERSIGIVEKVKREYGVETMAHLTCVGATPESIESTLDKLEELGVENILALRGDPPAGSETFTPVPGGFAFARDLIGHIKRRNRFGIAAAAYPEGHLECRNVDQDIEYLKLKADAGVDLLITQLFFDNGLFYAFLEKARRKGINCPVSTGIMPVLNAGQIKRLTALCGASIPTKLTGLMEKYGGNPADMEKAGIEYACQQIYDLVRNKVDGIHICTMNKAEQTKEIMANLQGVL